MPACVNPGHLFVGTAHDNVLDMDAKGRRPLKLTSKQVAEIRARYGTGPTLKGLASEYGVHEAQIWRIVHHMQRPRVRGVDPRDAVIRAAIAWQDAPRDNFGKLRQPHLEGLLLDALNDYRYPAPTPAPSASEEP